MPGKILLDGAWVDLDADLATQAELDAHTADTTAAHAASAIAFTPDGNIAATTVQAAIVEVRDEVGGGGAIRVEDEGGSIVAAATGVNFAGAGVTVTDAGANEALVTIPGTGVGLVVNLADYCTPNDSAGATQTANQTGLQSAVNAAVAAKQPLYVPAGDWYIAAVDAVVSNGSPSAVIGGNLAIIGERGGGSNFYFSSAGIPVNPTRLFKTNVSHIDLFMSDLRFIAPTMATPILSFREFEARSMEVLFHTAGVGELVFERLSSEGDWTNNIRSTGGTAVQESYSGITLRDCDLYSPDSCVYFGGTYVTYNRYLHADHCSFRNHDYTDLDERVDIDNITYTGTHVTVTVNAGHKREVGNSTNEVIRFRELPPGITGIALNTSYTCSSIPDATTFVFPKTGVGGTYTSGGYFIGDWEAHGLGLYVAPGMNYRIRDCTFLEGGRDGMKHYGSASPSGSEYSDYAIVDGCSFFGTGGVGFQTNEHGNDTVQITNSVFRGGGHSIDSFGSGMLIDNCDIQPGVVEQHIDSVTYVGSTVTVTTSAFHGLRTSVAGTWKSLVTISGVAGATNINGDDLQVTEIVDSKSFKFVAASPPTGTYTAGTGITQQFTQSNVAIGGHSSKTKVSITNCRIRSLQGTSLIGTDSAVTTGDGAGSQWLISNTNFYFDGGTRIVIDGVGTQLQMTNCVTEGGPKCTNQAVFGVYETTELAVRGCRFIGKTSAIFQFYTADCTSLNVDDCDFTGLTGGNYLFFAAYSSGKAFGQNNVWGSYCRPNIGTAGHYQNLKLRGGLDPTPIASAASISPTSNFDTITVSGATTIDTIYVGGTANNQKGWHGARLSLIGAASATWKLGTGGNISPGTFPVVEGQVITLIYDAVAVKWRPTVADQLPAIAANTAITAVSGTIRNDAQTVTLTADNSYTLTSAPTVAAGVDGQVLRIVNVDTADTITIQDQGTLASSNLRLTANTVAIAPRQSVELTYSATVGDWVQTGALVTVI